MTNCEKYSLTLCGWKKGILTTLYDICGCGKFIIHFLLCFKYVCYTTEYEVCPSMYKILQKATWLEENLIFLCKIDTNFDHPVYLKTMVLNLVSLPYILGPSMIFHDSLLISSAFLLDRTMEQYSQTRNILSFFIFHPVFFLHTLNIYPILSILWILVMYAS